MVEICIVLAVAAMVLAVIFIVIDPAAKQAAARNAQRWTDITLLMDGVQTAFTETHGELSGNLERIDTDSQTVQVIVNGSQGVTCGNICGTEILASKECAVDFSGFVNDGYIATVPLDPKATDRASHYYVNFNDGVFTVGACNAEQEKNGSTPTIRISR